MENMIDNKRGTYNIQVCYYGEEMCKEGHFHGPAVRDEYLIHYIIKGQGYYEVNHVRYDLRAQQGFLIRPGDVIYYKADTRDPWHYAWVGFKGNHSDIILEKAGLNSNNLTFTYNKDNKLFNYFNEMNQLNLLGQGKEELITGLTYLIFGTLIKSNASEDFHLNKTNIQEVYLQEALRYIQNNYYKELTITSLSKFLGIDRSYIYMIFRKKLNISPKTYIMDYRFKKACNLLTTTELSINDIAYSIGYKDALTFSKAFKKIYKLSPTHYRMKHGKKNGF